MATRDERVRVAQELAAKSRSDLGSVGLLKTLKEVLGIERGSWRDVLSRLSELIKPDMESREDVVERYRGEIERLEKSGDYSGANRARIELHKRLRELEVNDG